MRPQDKADASEQNPHIVTPEMTGHALDGFHALAREWYRTSFPAPTKPQALGWPVIKSGASTLILSPTGSGKTLTAFMSAIDRLMFEPFPPKDKRYSVIYLSPLKALAVDVERNLRAANDPANPYGTALPWLERPEGRRPMRLAGAHVILVDGALAAWLAKRERQPLTFADTVGEREPEVVRNEIARVLAAAIGPGKRRAILIEESDSQPIHEGAMAPALTETGFIRTSNGYLKRL